MGYLYLSIALFAGLAKGYCGKTISNNVLNFKDCLFVNILRMLICSIIGFIIAFTKYKLDIFQNFSQAFPVYLLAGISMSIFCICWMYAYRSEAYMFLSIFSMLGTVLTCLFDVFFYKTPFGLNECIGICFLLGSVLIMSLYNKDIKGKLTLSGQIILIIGSLGSSLADFSQKIYVREIGTGAETFNFYMYFVGFVLLLILFFLQSIKKTGAVSKKLCTSKSYFIYFGMSFFLYLNSVTKTLAANFLPSSQIYPALQGSNLILSGIMSHILFKEKINTKGIIGMIIAFIGLMILV